MLLQIKQKWFKIIIYNLKIEIMIAHLSLYLRGLCNCILGDVNIF
jgi:hypothetical protein